MQRRMTVYLAGPISGLTYGGATDWREFVKKELEPIHAVSPMRAKHFLERMTSLSPTCEVYKEMKNALVSQKGIMGRDHWDASRCDALFVHLLGAQAVSIGTVMEMAWAYHLHKPVVCVMEEDGNLHNHMMLNETMTYRVPTIEEGLHVTRALFDLDLAA